MKIGKWTRISLAFAAILFAVTIGMVSCGMPLPWALLQPDSQSYLSLASSLANEGVFSFDGETPSARRELLYPLFLAVFIKSGLVPSAGAGAMDYLPVLIVQATMYLGALWLLGLLANRLGHEKLAPFVVLLGTLYLPISQYAFQLVSEVLVIFFVTCFVFFVSGWKDFGARSLLYGAACLGLVGLVKAIFIPFAVVMALMLLAHHARPRTVVLFLLIALVFPLSWTVRNYVVLDSVVLATTDGASSLYRGNMMLGYQPPSFTDSRIPQAVRHDWENSARDERSSMVREALRQRIADHPLEVVAQLFYKAFVLTVGLPVSFAHALLMGVRILFLCVVGSRVVPYWKTGCPSVRLILALSGYSLVMYTLIYTTPRYFAPASFLLIPLFVESCSLWLDKIRLQKLSG